MAKKGEATKERILAEAESLVFKHGLSGTSIDKIIERAGLTKGAFFHHYKSKGALAEALLDKAAATDHAMMVSCMERAENLSPDPLQQVLIYVGLNRELVASSGDELTGCMFASFIYQKLEVPFDLRSKASDTFGEWRDVLGDKLALAKKAHPPLQDFDPYDLANMFTATFEGGLVMSQLFEDPSHVLKALDMYRDLVSGYFGILGQNSQVDAAE